MEKKNLCRMCIVLLCLVIASAALNAYLVLRPQEGEMKTEVVSHTETRENLVKQPEIASETKIGSTVVPVRYIFYPVAGSDSTKQILPSDSVLADENIPIVRGDSLEIPITQKVYSDSLYTAYVSGYMQRLDSIRVRERLTYTTVTNTRTVTKMPLVTVGVTGGYGYGLKSRKIEPFVGIGVTVNLFRIK